MIRRYKNSDLDKAAIVLTQAFAEEPWNEKWNIELARTRIEELMSGLMSISFIFEEDDNILGVMIGRRTTYLYGTEYFIDEFYIAPAAQRKGIGTKMIRYAREELSREGFVDIVLNTEKGFPSEQFYIRNGFVQKESLIFMYLNF